MSEGEASSNEWGTTFDHLTIAQIVALVEHSNSPFTISYLRQLYRDLMEDRGHSCLYYEPHTTRFKQQIRSSSVCEDFVILVGLFIICVI